MRHVTLRQLRILDAAARQLHFGRAARELHLTQPAVSIQLKALEAQAGLPLFEQVGRRMHLTRAGEELARHARAALAQLREAEDALNALKGARGGELHLAATTTAEYFAPKLLAEFRSAHPGVKVRITVANREQVVRALADNAVDLAIMGRPPQGLDVTAVAFARHPLAFIAAPSHPLAGKRRVAAASLAAETFLIREAGSGTRNALEALLSAHRLRPAETVEMSSNETIKQAVMAGMGVSFLSMHTVGLELAAKRLAVLQVAGTPVMRDWHVIHREKKRLSPVALAFKTYLVERGAKAIAQALG
jgi:DNA-binding transcriptional LysR family regulator